MVFKLHKGLNINLKGKPAQEFFDVKQPDIYAIVPDDFHGVTPKVVVKEQEYVTAGGTLFVDKNHPEVKFVSPVSGVVTSVERGERRKVLSISIAAAKEQDYEEFGKKEHKPRGIFCAIGRCTDCVMVVDGKPNVRTCMTIRMDRLLRNQIITLHITHSPLLFFKRFIRYAVLCLNFHALCSS